MHTQADEWKSRAVAAERTVAVLKAKVLEMYGHGAQSMLHRARELARGREERNSRRRELLAFEAAELARHNVRLEADVARRAHALKSIVDNVASGFVLVDRNGSVLDGFSRSARGLLGEGLTVGAEIADLFGVRESSRRIEFQLGIDQVFEDVLPEAVSLAQMPRRFEVGGRVLGVEARLVRDDVTGLPEALLVTMNDVTDLEAARRSSREREVLIGILRQKSAFELFIAQTHGALDASRVLSVDSATQRRLVHTIKGNAASWGLDGVVARAHEVESHSKIGAAEIDALEHSIVSYLETHHRVLGIDYSVHHDTIDVSAADLRALCILAEEPDRSEEMLARVRELLQRPAREYLGPIEAFVERLAERLDKDVDLTVEGLDTYVDGERFGEVLRHAAHLIRNALDHGIEARGQRGSKPGRGRVTLAVRRDEAEWVVEVGDDGRGIQTDQLVGEAMARGLIDGERARCLSDREQVELVFLEGLSTANELSDVSGRGIGLSAVRSAVDAVGGRLTIDTSSEGTRVRARVPIVSASLARQVASIAS